MTGDNDRPTRGDRSGDVFAVLVDVTRRLSEGAALESVLGDIAVAATELIEGDGASVLLLDAERRTLLCRGAYGLSEAEAARTRFRLGEGLAGWVAAHETPVRVDDAPSDPRFRALRGLPPVGSICAVPLSGPGGLVGVLSVSASRRAAFSEESERLLRLLASSVAKDLENARLYRQAVTDPLTGALNRQWLADRLPVEMERHRRYGTPLSLLLVDADHFKAVNDRLGHGIGDEVLRALAHRLRRAVREVDSVVRYGGEEFLVVLPDTDLDGAVQVGDRVCRQVAEAPLVVEDAAGGPDIPVELTVSVGVAAMGPEDERPRSLIDRADAALYDAKDAGRGRVGTAPAA